MMFKLENVGYLGATPTIDTLVVIADHTDVVMVATQATNQFQL
jgi:hypothetical protein